MVQTAASRPDPEAGEDRAAEVTPGGQPAAVWVSASVRAWLRARRAGPRQPQVQRATQKRPCSVVVVRCSCPDRACSGPSCCAEVSATPATVPSARPA
ncbi:hypothetical protein GCM10010236_11210 [Streptomyces eurythermus]|nr:hypothetical protein GCM10010236_11210 [Streptomyces eurythermus]